MYIFSTSSIESGCPVCGFKISDLYSTQKLGCNFCYLFLNQESEVLLKNLQDGNTKHFGKRPKNKKKLLKEFFDYIIKKEMESEDSNSKDCKDLLKLLSQYF